MVDTKTLHSPADTRKKSNLGSVQLRHASSNQIILIPTPTNDPNDPLNWSKRYRWYLMFLVSLATFFSNFLAAGPNILIVEITADLFGAPPQNTNFNNDISKSAYFSTTTALPSSASGLGLLFWMPLMAKYGRRPIYISSYVLYTISAVWAGASQTYSSELAARIVMGFASGSVEVLGPMTISDIFFLHERGAVMAIFTCSILAGAASGIILAGLISIHNSWRVFYWVSTALIGTLTLFMIFTFPETIFIREEVANSPVAQEKSTQMDLEAKWPATEQIDDASTSINIPEKRSFVSNLRVLTGTYTQESFWTLFFRPIVFLILPQILWATLVMAGTIGFYVAISSNFASAFQTTYGFEPWQSGLCYISSFIGALIAVFFGGKFSDWVADIQTRRNGGVREPEMRLPAILVSVVTAPLGMVLYGLGIQEKLHWMCPTIALGLLTFAVVQATNISLVYTIDCYRPVAAEITVTQQAWKSAFGFLLSFYTNPWVQKSGYLNAFGAMAGISGGLIALGLPLIFWGGKVRRATWKWSLARRYLDWNVDREVGE